MDAVDFLAVADLLDHRQRLVDPDGEADTVGRLLEAEAIAGGGGGHAHHLPAGVDERAAGVAGLDVGLHLDQVGQRLGVRAVGVGRGDLTVERSDRARRRR